MQRETLSHTKAQARFELSSYLELIHLSGESRKELLKSGIYPKQNIHKYNFFCKIDTQRVLYQALATYLNKIT